MKKNRKLLLAAGLVAAAATSGGAFTGGLTLGPNVSESGLLGAAEVTVAGATITDLKYTHVAGTDADAGKELLTSVEATFAEKDIDVSDITVTFGSAAADVSSVDGGDGRFVFTPAGSSSVELSDFYSLRIVVDSLNQNG